MGFFKQSEALGKHFARRSHSNSWGAGFDQSQYSRDAFRVNPDVIKRVEKQFAKKRADLAASNRNTKFSLPKEFEHLSEVKEFLQQYVFYANANNKKTTKGNAIKSSTTAILSSSQSTKSNKIETTKSIAKDKTSNGMKANKKIKAKSKKKKASLK